MSVTRNHAARAVLQHLRNGECAGNPAYQEALDIAIAALRRETAPAASQEGRSGDKLRMDYINSLPQPFLVRFFGDTIKWPVHDIDVETGLMRIDVCGKLDVKRFSEVAEIWDDGGRLHDPDSFWIDAVEPAPCPHRELLERCSDVFRRLDNWGVSVPDAGIGKDIDAALAQPCAAPGEAGEWEEIYDGIVQHCFDSERVKVYRRRASEREGGSP